MKETAKVGQGREVSDGLEYSDNHRVCEEGSDALEGMMHWDGPGEEASLCVLYSQWRVEGVLKLMPLKTIWTGS